MKAPGLAYEMPKWSGLRSVPVGAGDVRTIPTRGCRSERPIWVEDGKLSSSKAEKRIDRGGCSCSTWRGAEADDHPGGCDPTARRPAPGREARARPNASPSTRSTGGAPHEVPGLPLGPGFPSPVGGRGLAPRRTARVPEPRPSASNESNSREADERWFTSSSRRDGRRLVTRDRVVTPDGRSYAYGVFQFLHHLYLVDGFR